MGLLSSKNKILSLSIAILGYTILSRAEFPVARSLTAQTSPTTTWNSLQRRHQTLRIIGRDASDGRNYFSCCFVFKLPPPHGEIEIPLYEEFVSGRRKHQQIQSRVTNGSDAFTTTANRNLIFISHGPCEETHTAMASLQLFFLDCVKLETSANAATRNLAMLLKTLNGRSKNFRGELDRQVLSAMRTTDSEASAICVLQHKFVIDNIIERLTEILIENYATKPQIVSIEFHGFTTRDMCPLCFTNMNIIQYLCNDPTPYNPVKFSFLKYLKHKLQTERYPEGPTYATATCSTKIFISSQKASVDNLNFIGSGTGEQDNCLHQFRLPDDPSPVTPES